MINIPYNEEAEQAVLGSILIGEDVIYEVDTVIKEKDFFQGKHGLIYTAMKELQSAGKPIDMVELTEILKNKKSLNQIGGVSYLTELLSVVPTTSSAKHYAEIVKEKSERRNLIRGGQQIIEIAEDEATPNPLNKAGSIFNKLEDDTGLEVKTPEYIVDEYVKNYYDRRESKGITGITCGFDSIDHNTKGFQEGNLIVLAASYGVGKSLLALQFALEAIKQGKQVLLFSLEMTDIEITDRMMSMYHNIALGDVLNGNYPDPEEKINELKTLPLFIIDDSVLTPEQIRTYTNAYNRKYGIDMIIFDYLQLGSSNTHKDEVQKITDVSRELKKIAGEFRMPVIALSQFSRGWEKQNRHPSLSDLRWSGSIAQDANVAMILHRDKAEGEEQKGMKSDGILWLEKNRHGRLGGQNVMFSYKKGAIGFLPGNNIN